MELAQVNRMHSMVWATRDELGDKWPTPNGEKSLAYAVTEVAEAIDAWLRLTRPNDKRNNVRDMDVFDELGQAAMMLLTALGREWDDDWNQMIVYINASRYKLSDIMLAASMAYGGSDGQSDRLYYTLQCLSAIDTYCVGVEVHLERALQKAKEKWGQ